MVVAVAEVLLGGEDEGGSVHRRRSSASRTWSRRGHGEDEGDGGAACRGAPSPSSSLQAGRKRESPSLVLVINDTKLLMLCVQVI